MSDRIYLPPSIGDGLPNDIFVQLDGSPYTRIYQRRGGDIITSRNIAIFIDGACAGNGTPWARAGVGVYFGEDSDYNISGRIGGAQTNQRAEIKAAICALRKVKELLEDGKLGAKTVVLVSDSSYVVNSMTDWICKWYRNGWTNARGYEVANKDDLQTLDLLVDELEDDYCVYVRFWHVDRQYNTGADKLAKEAVA